MGGDGKRGSVFISYSRRDKDLVAPVVSGHTELSFNAFIDYRDIPPGKQWQADLQGRLRRAHELVLCWSANAAESEWVDFEWRYAKKVGTRIIPVLIDETPLPAELQEINAVDLRELVRDGGQLNQAKPVVVVPESGGHLATVLIAVGALIAFYAIWQAAQSQFNAGLVILLIFGISVSAAGLVRYRQWRRWRSITQVVDRAMLQDLQAQVVPDAVVPDAVAADDIESTSETLLPAERPFSEELSDRLTPPQQDIKRRFLGMLTSAAGIAESEVFETSSITQDLGFDSLDGYEFLLSCEEAFGIRIPDSSDNGAEETVGAVLRLLFKSGGSTAPAAAAAE